MISQERNILFEHKIIQFYEISRCVFWPPTILNSLDRCFILCLKLWINGNLWLFFDSTIVRFQLDYIKIIGPKTILFNYMLIWFSLLFVCLKKVYSTWSQTNDKLQWVMASATPEKKIASFKNRKASVMTLRFVHFFVNLIVNR